MRNQKLWDAINNLKDRIKPLESSVVDCDKCKCVVRKVNAEAGEKRIETELVTEWMAIGPFQSYKDSIVTPYFCQRCKPKKKVCK